MLKGIELFSGFAFIDDCGIYWVMIGIEESFLIEKGKIIQLFKEGFEGVVKVRNFQLSEYRCFMEFIIM
jgi:hypothetical protein